MEQTIVDWLNWLRLRASEATVRAYGWQLRRLAKSFPNFDPGDFKERHLTQYLAERRFFDEWGDSAIKAATCAMRAFFVWVCGKKRSPAARLPVTKVKLREQRSLTGEQLDAVLSACDTSTRLGRRDVALLALMADSGIRASEACRLRLADLDLTGYSFRVVIKGGHEEPGIFTPETGALLAAWLAVRGECGVDTVFVSICPGKPSKRLTPNGGLRCIFRRLGRAAGLAQFSPHDLRRTYAVLTIENGGSSRLVQMGMRVSSLKMVERYSRNAQLGRLVRFLPMAGRLGG